MLEHDPTADRQLSELRAEVARLERAQEKALDVLLRLPDTGTTRQAAMVDEALTAAGLDTWAKRFEARGKRGLRGSSGA